MDLSDTRIVLVDLLKIPSNFISLRDCQVVKKICVLVGTRSARLAACGISAILQLNNRLKDVTVAIDGSLFEQYPHFGNRIRDTMFDLVGISADEIVIEQARDHSGRGAAICALLAQ